MRLRFLPLYFITRIMVAVAAFVVDMAHWSAAAAAVATAVDWAVVAASVATAANYIPDMAAVEAVVAASVATAADHRLDIVAAPVAQAVLAATVVGKRHSREREAHPAGKVDIAPTVSMYEQMMAALSSL